MPTKNAEEYIADAIESYIRNIPFNSVLVIIEDHSKDQTYEICRHYENQYPAKIILRKNPFTGKVNAINYGESLVQYNFIKFVDSDDFINQEFWEYFNTFSVRKESFIHPFSLVDKESKILGDMPIKHLKHKDYKKYLKNLTVIPKVSWTFFHNDIKGMFPMPEDLPFEDIWFSFYYFANGIEVNNVKQPLYFYRQHDSQTFGNIDDYSKERILFRFRRLLKALEIIERQEIFKELIGEVLSSKNICKFMLKEISISSFAKTADFVTFCKHVILRDFSAFYLMLRKVLWLNRRLKRTSN